MIALYDNLVYDATITADTEASGFDFSTGLKDTRLSRYGKSTDNDGWIKFDLGSAKQVDYICIKAHNFTATATVTLEGHTSDSWASPTFSKVLTVATTIYTTVDDELQWWRITVVDAALTYLQCGYAYLGDGLSMPGMDQALVMPYKTNSESKKSQALQLYGDKRSRYKAAEIVFPRVTEAQRQSINTMFDEVDITSPFILIFWENDVDVEEPLYCNFLSQPEFKQVRNTGLLWSLTLSIEECR